MCKDNNKTPASKMCLCDQSTYRTDSNTCISSKYYMSFIQCISFVYLICNKLFLFYKNQNKNVFYCVVISLSSSDICLYICVLYQIFVFVFGQNTTPQKFSYLIFSNHGYLKLKIWEDYSPSLYLLFLSLSLCVCICLCVCVCGE